MANLMPLERVQQRIYWMRGQKVMLSPDLAELYGVEPRAVVQAVVRNRARFPADFISTQKLLGLARKALLGLEAKATCSVAA